MYVSIAKSPSKNKRISKKEFLALSIRQQKQYLEIFPKSSYRFLLPRAGSNLEKKEKPKKEDKVKPFESAPKKKKGPAAAEAPTDGAAEPKQKRIRRKSFDALDDKDKEEYLKKYPKSVHKKAFDALRAKENPKLLRGTLPGTSLITIPVHGGAQHSEKEARALRVQEHKQVEAQIQRLNKDGAAVINKHSIKAVAKIEPRDLKVASKAIDENRHQIIDVVGERIQENPKLFGRGLKALGKLFNGAKKLRPKELRASKRVLVQVAMVALLGTGVMALSMGAAPIAVVASRMLYDVWLEHHRGGNPDDPKDSDIIPRLKRKPIEEGDEEEKATYAISERGDKKAQQYWKAQGYEWHSRSNRWEKPKASDNVKALPSPKSGKKKWSEEDAEDAEFAAASSQDEEPYEMDPDHEFVINSILDQLSDLFKYQDADRIKNLNDKIFAAASDVEEAPDLYRILFDSISKLAYSRLSGTPGKYLYGVFRVPLPVILEIVERVMQVPPEEEIDDVYSVHHFSAPTMLVTVGEDFCGIIHFMFTEV